MMDIIDIVIGIFVVAVSACIVARINDLRKKILAQNAQTASFCQLLRLARISSDNDQDENFAQANRNMELALRKGTGISNFGAEVRPMLEHVIQSTRQITDSKLSDEERHEVSLSISREVKKLSDLVENVLLMARIDSKRINYAMEAYNVGQLVRELYEEYNVQDGTRFSSKETGGCQLCVIDGRPSTCIQVDRLYLKKAIREVLKNAFTFSRRGDIFIGWHYLLGTDEVEIFVEDNGIGISADGQCHAFDVFYREGKSAGIGVGLFIARQLVEKMGGHVALASRQGVGTRVSFIFPCI